MVPAWFLNQVTIFGQSAGSMSVGLHYVSPEMYGSGHFARVIMESNYPGSNIHDLDEASVKARAPLFWILATEASVGTCIEYVYFASSVLTLPPLVMFPSAPFF